MNEYINGLLIFLPGAIDTHLDTQHGIQKYRLEIERDWDGVWFVRFSLPGDDAEFVSDPWLSAALEKAYHLRFG